MTAQVFQLPPHENMKPEEALSMASKADWKHVIIIGVDSDDDLMLYSSGMTRETANIIVDIAKFNILKQ